MLKEQIAEALLRLVTSAEEAAYIIGDLVEAREPVLRSASVVAVHLFCRKVALVVGSLRPAAMAGIAFLLAGQFLGGTYLRMLLDGDFAAPLLSEWDLAYIALCRISIPAIVGWLLGRNGLKREVFCMTALALALEFSLLGRSGVVHEFTLATFALGLLDVISAMSSVGGSALASRSAR